jgi:hypothetical protein
MATVEFNIPDEVQKAFQEVFAGEDQDAVITRLMKQAIKQRQRVQRRAAAIESLLELRRQQTPVSDVDVARARQAGRP